MTVALVYPPTCDPTAPYISVPLLTGWLRAKGIDVFPVDANVGAYHHLLRRETLQGLRARVDARYRELNRLPSLTHKERGCYLTLLGRLTESDDLPAAIGPALDCLRGRTGGFFDLAAYESAVDVVERALRLVGAAYAPLELSFSSYRSPFSLLTSGERLADAGADRNPYHGYYHSVLIPALLDRGVSAVGISVVFPGQIQPAYSLGHALRALSETREMHVTVGGPAITQILARLHGSAREGALEPFDTAVLYEGEEALAALVRQLEDGGHPRGIIRGSRLEDLSVLPPPDFDGLPLDRYLSPEPVLPYDFSRGCAWGKCSFCHYGLADAGTAPYRERPVERAVEHLRGLGERHGSRLYYLSEDSVRPEGLLGLAKALGRGSPGARWSTDVRPERLLTNEAAALQLREGGALSLSFGVESGSERVLGLIRKGIPLETIRAAIRSTAKAGIAVEAMVFTDFPTETGAEALRTLALLRELGEDISLFMCGTFGLTSGSAVAREPERFDIREIWTAAGDELGLGLQYVPRAPWKSARDQARLEAGLAALSAGWRFASYPWAGSLSTAHTMLWYDRFGPQVFRRLASRPARRRLERRSAVEPPRFDPEVAAAAFERDEAAIWDTMLRGERTVSRARYDELAALREKSPAPRRRGRRRR